MRQAQTVGSAGPAQETRLWLGEQAGEAQGPELTTQALSSWGQVSEAGKEGSQAPSLSLYNWTLLSSERPRTQGFLEALAQSWPWQLCDGDTCETRRPGYREGGHLCLRLWR